MSTEHRDISDSERHEPRGISTAVVGQVYKSDGAASGDWKDDVVSLNGIIADVSAPSDILIPLPFNCEVVSIKSVLNGAITVADSVVTITRGGDAAVIASYTVPFTGSAQGTTINTVPSGNTSLVANTDNYIKIATDGNSTTTAQLYVTVKVKVTE